jgi:predicted helicase
LITARSNKSQITDHFFCSRHIVETKCGESTTQSYTCPLYLYPSEMERLMGEERKPNFAPEFLQQFGAAIGRDVEPHALPQGVSAEDIFHYIYAVLHAPTYRARYAPFLRLDFPRVPLPRDFAQFESLWQLGAQLVALHTLSIQDAPVLNEPRHRFVEGGGNVVVRARVNYDGTEQRVTINENAFFENVDEETWSFRVGGYTPAEKWLKDRDGRTLTYDDQAHYRRLLIAQSETLRLLPAVDAALGLTGTVEEIELESDISTPDT